MNTTFPMLIRREFWEHRSLWLAPLIWVGIIVFSFSWGIIQASGDEDFNHVVHAQSVDEIPGISDHDREEVRHAIKMSQDHEQSVFAFSFLAITGLLATFSCVVVFFYLIDSLYTERKDRSILFWKSMPISDSNVVLSKLAVAMIVVPVGVILLAAVTQFLLYIVVWLRVHGSAIEAILPDWSFVAWLRSQAIALGMMLAGVLWYMPIAAYLLLLSAWAKNKVFLWTVLPPIALCVLEKITQGSTHVLEFLGYRFIGYIELLKIDPNAFSAGSHDSAEHLPRVNDVYDAFHLSNVFLSPEMWIGLAVAAAMIFAAIRIRRYRDES